MPSHTLRCLGLALGLAGPCLNAQIVSYRFDTDSLTPSAVDATVTAGSVSSGAGLSTLTYAEGNPSAGKALSASSWTVGGFNAAGNDYVEFTVGPKAGFTLSLTGVELDSRRSGTGPANWQLRSSVDSFAAGLGSGSPGNGVWTANQNVALNGAFAALAGGVTFRVYGYNATGSSGTLRLDNLEVFGVITPVPEPVDLGLAAALGVCGFVLIRRRRGAAD
jgi:MYXO-CTERM domain-containing protein